MIVDPHRLGIEKMEDFLEDIFTTVDETQFADRLTGIQEMLRQQLPAQLMMVAATMLEVPLDRDVREMYFSMRGERLLTLFYIAITYAFCGEPYFRFYADDYTSNMTESIQKLIKGARLLLAGDPMGAALLEEALKDFPDEIRE